MAKKNIKDEEKEYVLIKSTSVCNQFITIDCSVSLIYLTKDELIKYIKEHGEQSIKYIFKNQPIKIETIVNINE